MNWQPSSMTSLAATAKQERRAAKEAGPIKRWVRRVFLLVALVFGLLGFTGGTAQAWSWGNPLDSIGSYVSNICGPLDVGRYVGPNDGLDQLIIEQTASIDSSSDSLAERKGVPGAEKQTSTRATYIPSTVPDKGNSTERLNAMYGPGVAPASVVTPTYERYGFASLRWSSYGASCYGIGYYSSWFLNPAFAFFVKLPVMLAMGLMNIALGTGLASFALTMLQPVYSFFTAIATPWWGFLALVGGLITMWRTRGSLAAAGKYVVFVIFCIGTIMYIGEPSGQNMAKGSSNLVMKAVGVGACSLSGGGSAAGQCSNPGNGLASIDNALWQGLAYEPWAAGQVGQREASAGAADRGQPNWGAAMLNAMYLNPGDDAGKQLAGDIKEWDGGSYEDKGNDGAKLKYWTDGFETSENPAYSKKHKTPAYQAIPFLQNVRALCNDTSKKGGESKYEKFMYDGRCETDDRSESVVRAIRGDDYDQRLLITITASIGAQIMGLVIIIISSYVTALRFAFVFLLGFAALWLTIAMWGDEKRKAFARRYFEMLFFNLAKQGGAICVLLVISYTISAIMVPASTSGSSAAANIPWIFKPWLMIMFTWALLLMIYPFMKLSKAIAAGDTRVVEKTGNAPVAAAKAGAKAAAATGVIAATGGAPAVKGAASSMGRLAGTVTKPGGLAEMAKGFGGNGSASSTMRSMSRGVGAINKGAGHNLRKLGHLTGMAERMDDNAKRRAAGGEALMGSPLLPPMKGESLSDYRKRAEGVFANISKESQERLDTNRHKAGAHKVLAHEAEVQGATAALMQDDPKKYAGPGGAERARMDAKKLVEENAPGAGKDAAHPYAQGFNHVANAKKGDGVEADQQVNPAMATPSALANRGRWVNDPESGEARWVPDATNISPVTMRDADGNALTDDKGEPRRVLPGAPALNAAGEAVMDSNGVPMVVGFDGHPQEAGEFRMAAADRPDGAVAVLPNVPTEDETRESAEKVSGLIGSSQFTRNEDIYAQSVTSGRALAESRNLSAEAMVKDPSLLLSTPGPSGELAYQGSLSNMDPSHPAAEPLTRLMFAQAGGADEAAIAEARLDAGRAIAEHGAPDEVVQMRSHGDAASDFTQQQLLGAMRVVTPDMSWEDRAETAYLVNSAAATMPSSYPQSVTRTVEAYADAVSSPDASAGDIEALRMVAYEAVMRGASDAASDAGDQLASVGSVAAPAAAAGGVAVAASSSLFGPDEPPVSSYDASEMGVPADDSHLRAPDYSSGAAPVAYEASPGADSSHLREPNYSSGSTAAGSSMFAEERPVSGAAADGWSDVPAQPSAPVAEGRYSLSEGVAPERREAPAEGGVVREAAMGADSRDTHSPISYQNRVEGGSLSSRNGSSMFDAEDGLEAAKAALANARRMFGGGTSQGDDDENYVMRGDEEIGEMSDDARRRTGSTLFGDDEDDEDDVDGGGQK